MTEKFNIIVSSLSSPYEGGYSIGTVRKVFASRREVVKVGEPVREDIRKNFFHDTEISVLVELEDGFDYNVDYLLLEEVPVNNPLTGIKGERKYILLAGVMPAWASFPTLWKEWVRNEDVRQSAIAHIRARRPDLSDLISKAERKTAKRRIGFIWARIAQECGLDLEPEGSWTHVLGLAPKIARKLGGWQPPVQPPIWEKKGGVLIAEG